MPPIALVNRIHQWLRRSRLFSCSVLQGRNQCRDLHGIGEEQLARRIAMTLPNLRKG
ncbi:MAG: hypothetical protein JO093_21300 [Acidobacteria bacterium]|nr:hypothetical protein [Acidobacteriota bacterium]